MSQLKKLDEGVFELPDGSLIYTLDKAKEEFKKTALPKLSINDLILLLLYVHKDKGIRGKTILFKEIFLAEREIFGEYIFTWEDVPGLDSHSIKLFLQEKFDWKDEIKIKRSDDRIIKIEYKKQVLFLELDKDETKVILRYETQKIPLLIFQVKKDNKLRVFINNEIENCKFVPYLFGPYSFSVANKITNMISLGLIEKRKTDNTSTPKFFLTKEGENRIREKFDELPDKTKEKLLKLRKGWDQYGRKGILNDVYNNYSQFTKKSRINNKYKIIKWGKLIK